jgi:hypothetical protein
MTRLVRSGRGGGTIHLNGCPRAKGRVVVGWEWAEGRSDDEWLRKAWLRPCRVCLPEQAALQDTLRAAHEAQA